MRFVRRTLVVVAVVIVAVVGAAAYALLPAHLQIRRIAPELPDAAALRELLEVPDGPVSLRYANTSTQQLGRGEIGHPSFVVEWEDGRLFLIDLGMDRAKALEFAELLATIGDGGEVEVHGDIAELLGSAVPRVAAVGFTHLHIDHTQGVGPFCGARGAGARLYRTRWQAEEHNLHTEEGADLVARSCLEPGTLEGGTILTAPEFPGIGLVALGGHTPGSTLFAVAVDGHLWLLSGDVTNTRRDLDTNAPKGFVYSYLIVPEDTSRTETLRLWLRDLDRSDDVSVVVSHDLGDLRSHLEEIRP